MSPNFSTPYLSAAASAQLQLDLEEIVKGAFVEAELNQLLKLGPQFLKVFS